MQAMWPSLRSIFKALGFVPACAAVAACASRPKATDKPVPQERVYFASFDEIERAIKQAMIRYPPKVDNSEAGIFETDFIKGDLRFKPPNDEKPLPSGYRYRVLIRVVRGRADDRRPAAKVVVTKQPELARDFFSDPEPLGTDGLEEDVILYRIQRELAIDRAIRRAQDRANRDVQNKQ